MSHNDEPLPARYSLVHQGRSRLHWRTLAITNVNSNSPCAHCPCNSGVGADVPTNDFNRPRAKWVKRRFTTATWNEARPNQGVALFRLAFISCLTYYIDLMHAKFLGSDGYFLGSVIFILIFDVLDGSPDDNLAFVLSLIKQYYRTHEYWKQKLARFKTLKMTMVVANPRQPYSAFPKLKGKAAEIRHVAPAVLEIWRNHCNCDDVVVRGVLHICTYGSTESTN